MSETDCEEGAFFRPLRWRRFALWFYALAIPLTFPHAWPGGGVFDAGLVFVWVVTLFLVVGIAGRTPRGAARAAFGASLLGHALLFHWFYVVTVVYGGMPGVLGVAAPLVPALYISLFSALFAAAWAWLAKKQRASIVIGAALWVTLDWMRAYFLGGFPWATLGYGLHLDIPLLGITRWTGIYGLSFAAAATGIAAAQCWLQPGAATRRALLWTAAAVAAAHGLGAFLQPDSAPAHSGEVIEVAAIQGNIDQGQKWDTDRRDRTLQKYLARSASAAADGAEWVVWPETAVPGLLEFDPDFSKPIREIARSSESVLFIGAMGFEPQPGSLREGAFFDSAFVIDQRGEIVDRYDKTELVPFGEFVPLRSLLGKVFKALATGLSNADVTAGARPRVVRGLDLPSKVLRPEDRERYQVATPICYELLFPHAIRGFAADGADVLLAMTNDAWYGRTGAPHQFLAMTAIRAAENGLWLVRSANTGISAIIDDRGRVRERSALFEEATVRGAIPISTGGPRTFYAKRGDLFSGICCVLAGAGLAMARRSGRRPVVDEELISPKRA